MPLAGVNQAHKTKYRYMSGDIKSEWKLMNDEQTRQVDEAVLWNQSVVRITFEGNHNARYYATVDLKNGLLKYDKGQTVEFKAMTLPDPQVRLPSPPHCHYSTST